MSEELFTVATRANMEKFERAHPAARRAMLLDVRTGETYSASSGDYWTLPLDAPITMRGEPLLLVTEHTIYRDALTGRQVE